MFANPFLISPFTLLRRMTEEVDRTLGEPGARGGRAETVWAPAIEVNQQEGKYIVRAELPGLKPEEVKIEVTDDALILEGERKFEQEENTSGVRRTERMYGRFYRVIPLPEGANTAEARARFENGVLEVTVPVTERQSNRRQLTLESNSNEKSGREKS
jgi:HSP20 family protein